MAIGQIFQDVSVVHGGVAIGHLDVAPAFERREQHEQVGGAVALVLVIDAGRASPFHRDRQARLGKELLGGLVQAHQRVIGIARPRVDRQHIFHGGYERAVGLRRDDPALPAMGLGECFFKCPPNRGVAGAIDNLEFHDLFLQQPQGPARASLGRFGTSQRNQFGFFLAVKNPCNRRYRPARKESTNIEPPTR